MKVGRSAGYALVAIGYIANRPDDGIIQTQKIAAKYKIPLEYLLLAFSKLVKANILRSKRGPDGGFILARPAGKITLLEIIEAVEGRITGQLDFTEDAPKERLSVKTEAAFEKAIGQVRDVFAKIKLSDLL